MKKPLKRSRRTKQESLICKNLKRRSTLTWRLQRQRKQLWQYRISLDDSRRKRSRKAKNATKESVWRTKKPSTIFKMERELIRKRQRRGLSHCVGGKLGVLKTNDSPLASTCRDD